MIREWFVTSWFSCRKFAERMSRSVDRPLSTRDRLGYLFHFYWCFTCRRVSKQIRQLDRELGRYLTEEDLDKVTLPQETIKKISEKLSEEKR